MSIKEYIIENKKLFFVQLTAPALGLLSFAVYSLVSTPQNHSYPVALTITLAITLIANIAGTAFLFAELKDENIKQNNESFKKIENAIKVESKDFRNWQESLLGQSYKIETVAGAQLSTKVSASMLENSEVMNTYVNLCKITGTKGQGGASIITLYEQFLSRSNTKWIDLCGVEDFLDGRFSNVVVQSDANSVHELNIISDSLPIINFMLMAKNGNPSEVYFGWLMSDTSPGEVYYSSDSRLVDLFKRYFDLLLRKKKQSITVDYSLPVERRFSSLTIELIRGTWLSVSTSNTNNKADGFNRYSIIKIYVLDGGWLVKGRVYERKTGKIIHEIESTSAALFEGGVFYRFKRTDADGHKIVVGHGTYQITAYSNRVATGVYVALSEKRMVHNLRAVKINDSVVDEIVALEKGEVNIRLDEIQQSIEASV